MTTIVHATTPRYTGRVFTLVTESVTLENGVTTDLDLLRHPGAAAIVALDEDNCLRLIHQYRHVIGGRLMEIPAGTLEKGESPLQCARRELAEEAGVRAERLRKLGEITPVPGYSDERVHLFLATELSPAPVKLDEDEIIEIVKVDFAEALNWIDAGKIVDAKTISGILLAERFLRN